MEIYLTDLETHEYIGSDFADISPLEDGVFIIPAGAYIDKPPTAEEGKTIVRIEDGWELVDDYRETPLYLATPTKHQNTYTIGTDYMGNIFYGLGVLPEWLMIEPQEYLPTSGELAEEMRAKRDKLIEETRWRIERHQDEILLGLTPTEELLPILQYIQDLRDIPQQDSFPNNIIWPEL